MISLGFKGFVVWFVVVCVGLWSFVVWFVMCFVVVCGVLWCLVPPCDIVVDWEVNILHKCFISYLKNKSIGELSSKVLVNCLQVCW